MNRRNRSRSRTVPTTLARKDGVELRIEAIRDHALRIGTAAREEREAFLSFYETKREFRDRLAEQLESLLEEELLLRDSRDRERPSP
ncbi:hypothetical protein [Cohnella panacarvi]|uniref:hypothetical protein n=1 Tax=Cohnella panacarvi TaxID=400776 RepID=UPI00047DCF8E|nr:hypothetical protein [Cohnella panacarvi]